MILSERCHSVENVDGLKSVMSIFNNTLKEAIASVKFLMHESSPIAYLKDTVEGHFVKLKWNNGVIEASYILDFFDFQKEFFEKAGIKAQA